MKINRLIIKVNASNRSFGLDLEFHDGLNLIRAENTSGKTTCMQAIVYCLGLEGALGPSRKLPLKSALTKYVKIDESNQLPVNDSDIYLEIENNNKKITIKRNASEENNNLVSVWDDYIFSENADANMCDYYVRDPGSATKERGFHNFLAEFLELELPMVSTYEGKKSPLYLEALFSLLYVEQTRGWGGIQNILPTYFQIRDVGSKSIEYLLNMDSFGIHSKKQEVNESIKLVEERWIVNNNQFRSIASNINGVEMELVEKPQSQYLDSYNPIVNFQLDDGICTIYELEAKTKLKLSDIKEKQLPNINQVSESIIKDIESKEKELDDFISSYESIHNDFITLEKYVSSIDERVDNLEEDKRKYSDIKKLIKMGSNEKFSFNKNVCPTCHQTLNGTLLDNIERDDVYDVEENISFIKSQIDTFKKLKLSESTRLVITKTKLRGTSKLINILRARIRDLRSSLISDGRLPSRAALREEMMLENDLSEYENAIEEIEILRENFGRLSAEYDLLLSRRRALPSSNLSLDDRKKLAELLELFKTYLKKFNYTSEDIQQFEISEQNYKPTIDDVELGLNSSASDNIRMIWAYLYSLLSLSRDEKLTTNHPGILILDEPRQQSAKGVSFEEFIKIASETNQYNQQIIIATSENEEQVMNFCKDLQVNLMNYKDGVYMIKELSESNEI